MSMNKKLLLLLSLIVCVSLFFVKSSAESGTSAKTPDEQVEQFFSTYKDDTDRAVVQLFKSNRKVDVETNELTSKLKDVVSKTGRYNGYELIIKRKAGNSMVLHSYMAKHDIQPLRINFIFYKPKDEWMIYKFSFDTEIAKELTRSAELLLIEETYIGAAKK